MEQLLLGLESREWTYGYDDILSCNFRFLVIFTFLERIKMKYIILLCIFLSGCACKCSDSGVIINPYEEHLKIKLLERQLFELQQKNSIEKEVR